MLSRAYNIIIDCSVGGLGHSRYVVNGINYVNIFINVNGKVSISWKRGLWQSYGNSNINPYRIHKYSKRIKYFQMDHVKMILLIKVSIENGMVNGSRLILSIVAKSRSVWIMKMLKGLVKQQSFLYYNFLVHTPNLTDWRDQENIHSFY